jgi:hypothetical protein
MNDTLLERLVLGEIEGKNRAIHSYDDIVWKIRSGFLTLIFGGWAILLRGILEAKSSHLGDYRSFVFGLLLLSLGFAFGAWYIDRSYLRRKFRGSCTHGQVVMCVNVQRRFLPVDLRPCGNGESRTDGILRGVANGNLRS